MGRFEFAEAIFPKEMGLAGKLEITQTSFFTTQEGDYLTLLRSV